MNCVIFVHMYANAFTLPAGAWSLEPGDWSPALEPRTGIIVAPRLQRRAWDSGGRGGAWGAGLLSLTRLIMTRIDLVSR